ncbi:MAG: RnfABCDGE type electron transport complex subunit B [Clostridiales bacterium]|nr:RnfABCDGE type electron transport complex subunit B [Clostridiales bacterium]MBS5878071.1 RnfABCDGE type electron transport complex subunit B [Clostridiales bacterium]MDU0939303.1 RnfABCDGE type electron transport complex subunit B [Clostridiales bacterium]MDU1042265.1 RnfABCDGE type electron transport complex subunit B [Clostridiales bacterium]MDU3489634.1 RnfABCDGE type electron transport complex subunit B [Clostridiales bacterium]
MSQVLLAAIIVGAAGIGLGFFLSIMSKRLEVPVDEKEEKIREMLPGNNCGACGYPGCDGAAAAVARGEAPPTLCPVGGPKIADMLAELTGGDAAEVENKVAFVKCAGDCEHAKENFEYTGVNTCAGTVVTPNGGAKGCEHGCRGFGDCVDACEFDAIHIINGIAVVDKEKCVACEKCVAACPKDLIEMIPYKNKYAVQCNSPDRAKDVMMVCSAGCIGCKKCERACPLPEIAIHVNDNLAKIDYSRCINCGKCAEACPTKVIEFMPLKSKAKK